MTLPGIVETDEPLPGAIRRWIQLHAGPLMKALLNETALLYGQLRTARQELAAARQRIKDLEEGRNAAA